MIVLILLLSTCIRVWYVFQPTAVLWDSAMYIGIGKYIFSHGTIGVWEAFRPPLLPIIFGAAWKLGLQPFIIGEILSVLTSIGLVWLTYKTGAKITKNTGLFAALFVGLSVITIAFSNAPLSDLPSVFLTTLVVLLVINKKYMNAGMCAALAFLTRFPQALIIIPCLLYIIFIAYTEKETLKQVLSTLLKFTVGFLIFTLPYFVVNIVVYHNPFLPILLANKVASDPINALGRDIFFYPLELLKENIFFAFSLISLISLYLILKKVWHRKNLNTSEKVLLLMSVCLFIVGGYFNFNTHLELRYTIAFIPFLAVLSGYGIDMLFSRISSNKKNLQIYTTFCSLGIATAILLYICFIGFTTYWPMYRSNPELDAFYSFFKDKPGVSIITTSPQNIVYSDVTIVEAVDTWENADEALQRGGSSTSYFAFNDCALACEGTMCDAAKKDLYTTLQENWQKSFNGQFGSCNLEIYHH